jgi:hypothetical protein
LASSFLVSSFLVAAISTFYLESRLFELSTAVVLVVCLVVFVAVVSSSFFLLPPPIPDPAVAFYGTVFLVSTGLTLVSESYYVVVSFGPGVFFGYIFSTFSSSGFFLSIVAGLVDFGSIFAVVVVEIPSFLASAALSTDVTPPAFSLSFIA